MKTKLRGYKIVKDLFQYMQILLILPFFRYSMVVQDGVVQSVNVEPDGTGLTCSLAEKIQVQRSEPDVFRNRRRLVQYQDVYSPSVICTACRLIEDRKLKMDLVVFMFDVQQCDNQIVLYYFLEFKINTLLQQ